MKKALVVLALGSTAAYLAWSGAGDRDPADGAVATANLTADRVWIDHIPTSDRDKVQVFAALSQHSIGIFQQLSQWQGAHEIFKFEAHGEQLRVVFPQTGEREKLTAKSRPCSEGPMDYCLELSGSKRGVKRYYSMKGWEIDGVRDAAALEARTDGLVDQLTAQ